MSVIKNHLSWCPKNSFAPGNAFSYLCDFWCGSIHLQVDLLQAPTRAVDTL